MQTFKFYCCDGERADLDYIQGVVVTLFACLVFLIKNIIDNGS